MEREGWRRFFCLASLVVVMFARIGESNPVGAQCWACNYEDSDEVCQQKPRYLPELAVVDSFCSDVRNTKPVYQKLCEAFPNGYKILCERQMAPHIKRCRSQVCLVQEAKGQTGSDSGAPSAQSRHAPGFLWTAVFTAAFLVTWTVRWC